MSKTVLFVAHDMAPSECFSMLEKAIGVEYPEVTCLTHLGFGREPRVTLKELERNIERSGLVIIGMSSSARFSTLEVRAAILANDYQVPVAFYADTVFVPMRARDGAWFANVRDYVSYVVGALPHDKGIIQELYPNACCIATGNPVREQMSFPKYDRAHVRSYLGISDDQYLIIAPGTKHPFMNFMLWSLISDALYMSPHHDRTVVILAPHPGDQVQRAQDAATGKMLSLYEEIVRNSSVAMQYRPIKEGALRTLDIVSGADLIIECSTSIGIAAAYQQIPLISFAPRLYERVLEEENGGTLLETVANSSSVLLENNSPRELAGQIDALLNHNSYLREKITRAQKAAYPAATEHGSTCKALTSWIMQVLNSN